MATTQATQLGGARKDDPVLQREALRPVADVPRVAPPPTVAAVVLNWNGYADTERCIESLLGQRFDGRLEIFVVDNASDGQDADRIEQRFGDHITLIRNSENLGFTGGHTPAFERVLARDDVDFVALLNNDAFAEPDWVAQLVGAAADRPEVGAWACLMVFDDAPDITENAGIVVLPTGDAMPYGRGRQASYWQKREPVLGACGGACLLRVELLREIGGFREDFFINFEDVDLALRAMAHGWQCVLEPKAIARHRLGQSYKAARTRERDIHSVRNSTWAWLVNTPAPVLLLTAPIWLTGYLLTPIGALLLGRSRLANVIVRGRLRVLGELGALWRARREMGPRRGTWRYLKRISFWPRHALRLLREARRKPAG